MLKKTYDTLDSALMKGVNTGVRAWNWTTGKTKADLANLTFGTGCALFTTGGFSNRVFPGFFYAAVSLPQIPLKYAENMDMERREMKAMENSCKDTDVELAKKFNAKVGHIQTLAGLSLGMSEVVTEPTKIGALTTDAGLVLMGMSHHVMRAEYLPPRKHCLARGFDKLKDALKQYAPQPQPIPVRNIMAEQFLQ